MSMGFWNLQKGFGALLVLVLAQYSLDVQAHGAGHKKQAVNTQAHVHGVGELDVVSEGNGVSVTLFSPLHNVLGFERAPKTAAEKDKAKLVQVLLNDPRIVSFNADALCTRVDTALTSDVLNPHTHGNDADHHAHDHSDILMRWEFQCEKPAELRHLTVRVFNLFEQFTELQAQVLLQGRQLGARLTPKQPVLKLR